jgi:hypothetical protein
MTFSELRAIHVQQEMGTIWPYKVQARLKNIQYFSPYHKENTTLHHFRDAFLTLFKELSLFTTQNRRKHKERRLTGC